MKKVLTFTQKRSSPFALIGAMALSIVGFASCGTSDTPTPSTEKPTITVKNINKDVVTAEVCHEMHNNVIKTNTGTNLILELEFQGSNELSQYKVEIHENADCHDHGERPLSEWSYNNIVDLSGKSAIKTETIAIPSDADLTQYHFEIQVVDNRGTESEHTEYNLVLE